MYTNAGIIKSFFNIGRRIYTISATAQLDGLPLSRYVPLRVGASRPIRPGRPAQLAGLSPSTIWIPRRAGASRPTRPGRPA